MLQLKNYLEENNISVKDFAKITKVKEKKLNRVLEDQAFFSGDEAEKVAAFLGVSSNELYHGVVERKGELPEVAEQNNLNHFKYFIKNRFKNARRFNSFLDFVFGCGIGATSISYIVGMFMGITGLPTLLRSADTMLFGFLIPVLFIEYFVVIASNKVFKKCSVKGNGIKIEGACISALILMYAITCFTKEFIPVESFVLTVLGAVALLVLSIIPLFKTKPFKNRFLHFVVYLIPTVFLIVADVFSEKYVEKITPAGEELFTESLSSASAIMGLVFYVIILGVFSYSLVLFYNVFIEGIGQKIQPMKLEKSISRKKFVMHTVSSVLVGCIIFLGINASQGLYLKFLFTNIFDGQEDIVNWTSEFITDFETQFKKGEYDIIEFEGMEIKIPEGFSFDKKSEYSIVYKKGEDRHLIVSKPIGADLTNMDLEMFGENFGDGKYTEEQKAEMKEDFVKYFGFYPQNMYEWQKIQGLVTLDDVDMFNARKTAMLMMPLMMKAVAGIPDSEYYLYENGDLYATINIHIVENEETGNREIVSVSYGTMDLEYSFTLAHPDQDNSITIEEVTKILNSIEQNKSTK